MIGLVSLLLYPSSIDSIERSRNILIKLGIILDRVDLPIPSKDIIGG